MRKVPPVGVETRVKGGRSHGDLTKTRLSTIAGLKSH